MALLLYLIMKSYYKRRLHIQLTHLQKPRHNLVMKGTYLFLKKGLHPFRVDYLIGNGNDYYDLQLEGPGLEKQTIPSTLLFN